MAYCTLDDIKKILPEELLIQITDDELVAPVAINPENEACAAIIGRIDEAILAAEREVDAYCGNRYHVPFDTPPGIVTKASADISVYNLYARRMEEIPETRAERYKNAIRLLEGIAKGNISIGIDPEPRGTSVDGACTRSPGRVFTGPSLKGF